MNYLILQNPGHNRVYYNAADKLALAELKLASEKLSTNCNEIQIASIENIRYLSIETKDELSNSDLDILSRLSFVFAIFTFEKINNKHYLAPIKKYEYEYIDSKISNLLKYPGKTNELFTKMMVNVALLSSDFNYSDNIMLLDPIAGKGTTLYESAVYGFNSYGIELETKFVHESNIFFKKYLENEHIKHKSNTRQIFSKGKKEVINLHEFEYALTKEDFKDKKTKKLGFINGNTLEAYKYFKKESFHLIVGDLPYGIAHGNKGKNKTGSITRNPSELLEASLPEWGKVLLKGGVIVMAWNSFLVSRQKLSELFKANGFEVLSQNPYDEFEHMVDKSIKRDIVVAKKIS
jgi:hypothetical protein